ncbi:MAG: HAMP domain-containing protein [Lachnospiraceae bacterium]|jgi:signal transduction histidine kinase|nr:HAMP domain-containing protein [Lachnospiraceae bacterium]
MKFSWKICFSTIMLSLLIFSIGGYVLISALFQSTYEREVANAGEENRMLQYSFVAYWSATIQDVNLSQENVKRTADAMVDGMSGSELRIRISDEQGQIFYDNAQAELDAGLLETITKTTRGHMLRKTENGYELQTASMVCLGEEQFLYLESIREVTELFEERDQQYSIYRQWLVGLLVAQSILCYLMATWLLRPLRRLSRATRRIAGGNLSVRARMESRDEIGDLAVDFNHMADNLEQQFQELEDAARRQEDFIGSFAHELKTPLTSMIGYADMLRTTQVTQEEQFQAANYIFKEGKRLESLSFKLLDLMVVKNQELELKLVKIRWLAEDIKGMLSPSLKKLGIVLKVIVEDVMLMIEPDLMKTVLLNLLDNGRKAIEGGGTLYLLGRKEEGGFAIYVRDTGKGIPKEELSRITEAFYMVDKSRARQQGGAGLGLAICAEIVKRHKGLMTFKSIPGKGTMVRIFMELPDHRET